MVMQCSWLYTLAVQCHHRRPPLCAAMWYLEQGRPFSLLELSWNCRSIFWSKVGFRWKSGFVNFSRPEFDLVSEIQGWICSGPYDSFCSLFALLDGFDKLRSSWFYHYKEAQHLKLFMQTMQNGLWYLQIYWNPALICFWFCRITG